VDAIERCGTDPKTVGTQPSVTDTVTDTVMVGTQPTLTGPKGEGEGEGYGEGELSSAFLDTDGKPSPSKLLWDEGVEFLVSHGNTEKAARSCIGKWRKGFGDERTHAGVKAAREQGVSEPVAWISAWLKVPSNAAPPRTAAEAMAQIDGWKRLVA